jgi:putative transposase
LNPVRAGLALKPEDWIYSNYREFIGLRNGTLYDATFVREQFETPEEYRKFVEDEIPNEIMRKLEKYILDDD